MRRCQCKLAKSFPNLYKLVLSKQHRRARAVASFFFGVFLGVLFYGLVLVDLDFTENAALIAGIVISLSLGIGAAISSQIRCIIFLTLPTFGGKAGRSLVKTLVVAFIISGPIENLVGNGKEVVRVFACTASLTYNLTKTRFELMFKPFSQALLSMKADVNEVKDTLRSIKDVSSPIVGEVEDESEMRKLKEENDYIDKNIGDSLRSDEIESKYKTKGEMVESERFEKLYLKKIEMRCQDQFTKASTKCRDMFAKAYDTCYDTVSWVAAWLLCWPMKLDFVCNIAQALGGASRCDPSEEIDPGFGEGYAYLKKSRAGFADNFKNVKMQYKLGKLKQLVDFRDTRDSAKAILHTVKEKKRLLDQFFVILKRLLAFVFLGIIIKAQQYHDKYLREIDFDNIYITPYFRKLDARRKAKEKSFLLPLKKVETKKLVDPCSPVPLKAEREQIFTQTVHLLIEMITATTLILLDRLFFEALDLVRRHAKIDYTQTGRHDLTLEIKGTGMIANLLRSVVRGFNVKKRIKIERSNEHCLPRPRPLLNYYLYKIYGTYFGIWLLMFFQVYTQRVQRVVCSFFYPKREKRRVLFLYNETLKRRIGFFRFMKKKVQKLVREHRLQENLNVCAILRFRYPKFCDCLRIFPAARRKCLICKETEAYSSKFHKCPNGYCYFVYCNECWDDLGKQCFACAITEDTSSGLGDSSEDDD